MSSAAVKSTGEPPARISRPPARTRRGAISRIRFTIPSAPSYHLRGSKGPESRNARLDDYQRIDYFRGKDLFRCSARTRTSWTSTRRRSPQTHPGEPGIKERDVQIAEIGERLMRDEHFVRIDRVYEDPRPAARAASSSKFMQTLPRQMQKFTDDGEGFYGCVTDGRCPGPPSCSASPRSPSCSCASSRWRRYG